MAEQFDFSKWYQEFCMDEYGNGSILTSTRLIDAALDDRMEQGYMEDSHNLYCMAAQAKAIQLGWAEDPDYYGDSKVSRNKDIAYKAIKEAVKLIQKLPMETVEKIDPVYRILSNALTQEEFKRGI